MTHRRCADGPAVMGTTGTTSMGLFSSVSNRLGTAQTFTVFIKGLQNRPDSRAALEKKLYSSRTLLLAADDALVVVLIDERTGCSQALGEGRHLVLTL